MGTLWRSEPMQLLQLFIQIEAAHDTVDELGKIGKIQFRDLNPAVNPFQRNFVNELRQADEMDRKLRFFYREIYKANLRNSEKIGGVRLDDPNVTDRIVLEDLDNQLTQFEQELTQTNNNYEVLLKNRSSLFELREVLRADHAAGAPEGIGISGAGGVGGEEESLMAASRLGSIAGVIKRSSVQSFERVLWRATRGNLYMKSFEIENDIIDPSLAGSDISEKRARELQQKNVVFVYFQGERAEFKIKKICESFAVNIYACPEGVAARRKLEEEVEGRLQDLAVIMQRTEEHRMQLLREVDGHFDEWRGKVLKEMAIYHTMNLFNYDIGRRCLIAEGWAPCTATAQVQQALRDGMIRSGSNVPSVMTVIPPNEDPPTHFETNKFTNSFQEIVNAYGIAHYREINPTPFAIITFPFLFGVMFGDVGHGLFLLIAVSLMLFKEKQLVNQDLPEMLAFPFGGRYLLLVMSFFAIYMGVLYNECFAVPMDVFGSAWSFNVTYAANGTEIIGPYFIPNPDKPEGYVYPIGIDPVWKSSPSELNLYNSVKMKFSIILGVIQMSLGIFLFGINAYNRRDFLTLFLEFIPMIVFMWSIFGYMCFLIFYKWIYTDNNPPLLLPIIINMFLSPGHLPEGVDPMFDGQAAIQVVLLIVAVLAVPIMLLPKPFILRARANSRAAGGFVAVHDAPPPISVAGHGSESEGSAHGHHDDHHGGGGGHGHGHGEHFEFGEVFIHQVIHTIEFALGSISNTASYLRLWALSLAHSELASVFFEQTYLNIFKYLGNVKGGLQYAMIPGFYIAFTVWAAGTIGVLCTMESLSAFLHGLRLHWVEFQNKFYQGDGTRFVPFAYSKILKTGNLSEDD